MLTGVFCFIIGIIFTIAALIGSVVFGIYYIMNANIDDLLGVAGVENTDSEGNKIYINTNEVENISELISTLQDLIAAGFGDLTIDEIANIFPVADSLVDQLYGTIAGIFSSNGVTEDDIREIIDEDELKSTALSGLSGFLMNSLYDTELQQVFNLMGLDPESDPLYMALCYGAEASVVISEDGATLVLYEDVFTLSDEGYVRENDGTVLKGEYENYLVAAANGTEYKLYFAVIDGVAHLAQTDDDEEENGFYLTDETYEDYNESTAELSGAYYYLGDELVLTQSPRTIRGLLGSDDGILASFSDVYINDIIAESSLEEDNIIYTVFDKIQLGDLTGGKLDFTSLFDRVHVTDILTISADSNAILIYIAYGITGFKPSENEGEYSYTATATYYPITDDDDAETYEAYVDVEDGEIISVYYEVDGEKIYVETSITEISTRVEMLRDHLTIGDIVGDADDNILFNAVRNSTLNSLITDIESLSVQQLFASTIYDLDEDDDSPKLVIPTNCEDHNKESDGYCIGNTNCNKYSDITLYTKDAEGEYDEVEASEITDGTLYYISYNEEYIEVILFNSAYLYFIYEDGDYSYVTNDDNNEATGHLYSYTYEDYMGGKIYYSYGVPTGSWRLLLYDGDAETICTINEVANMQDNLLVNLQNATLYELEEMGIIEISDNTLDTKIGEDEYMGDLTISGLIAYVSGSGTSQP